MKVVQIITPTRISGAEKYTIALSKTLIQMGCQVDLIVEQGQKLIDFVKDDLNVIPVKIEGKGNILGYQRLKKTIAELKPDIIHTHLTTASWFGSWIGKSLNIPVVSTVHAINSKWPYIKADKIIAVSQAVYDDLASQGVPKDKLVSICNGIPIIDRKPEANIKTNSLMEKWHIPATNFKIAVVAHFSSKKGHHYLLHAVSRLKKDNVTIILCGEGKLKKKLSRLCQKLAIDHQVIFSGFQPRMDDWYSFFDLLILPSIKGEGLPLSILECQSMEIPVIASSISGIGEVIVSGENGFLIPPKDIVELKNKISLLMNNRLLGKQMGINGREKVLRYFNISQNARIVEDLYQKATRC